MTYVSHDDLDDCFKTTVVGDEVPDSGSCPSQELAFINSTNDKRSDPATRTLIKKHVMRDIGKARRKGPSSRRKKAITFPLALAYDTPRDSREDTRNCTYQIPSTNSLATSQESVPRDPVPRSPNASVLDPFQHFPIQMDRRKHELLVNGTPYSIIASYVIERY